MARGRPSRWMPVAVGAALTGVIVALEVLPDTRSREAIAIAAIDVLTNASFVWAGVLGVMLRPGTPLGPAMMGVGVTFGLGNLVFAEGTPLAYTIGLLSIGLFTAPLTHVLLSYPDGVLRERADRAIVWAMYLHMTVQWWSFATTHDPIRNGCERCAPGANLVGIVQDADVYSALLAFQIGVSFVLVVLVLWRLTRRWRRASAVGRRLLGPMLAGGLVCAVVVLGTVPLAYETIQASGRAVLLHGLWLVGFGAIPVGYSVGLVRDAIRRTRLSALLAELAAGAQAGPLRSAVRSALGDASAEVLVGGADLEGRVTTPPPGRAVSPVGEDAVIVHDPALLQDAEVVAGVGRALGMALRNQRLEAEVRDRLDEALAARARVVEAGDEARRRIERDLHDGLQQTLVSLRLTLAMLQEEAALDGEAAQLLTAAREFAAGATDDLRSLAAGVYPMVLTTSGLTAALQELADTAPVTLVLDVQVRVRSLASVEAAAYFCCCEAITNVAKHAGAERCTITGRLAGCRLRLVIADEGRGGAALGSGSGLRGLADRAAAAGGELSLVSPPGGPTRLTVVLPWPAAAPARANGTLTAAAPPGR